MTIHVDNASFKVMQTADPNVFSVTFDYTEDEFENGWEAAWKSITIRVNKNQPENLDTIAAAAINATKPNAAANTVKAWLEANRGETVVRTDPSYVPEPGYGEDETKPLYVVVVTP